MPLDFVKGSKNLDYAEKVAGGALAEDVEGDTKFSGYGDGFAANVTYDSSTINCPYNVDTTVVSKTLTFDANSLAFATAFINCWATGRPLYRIKLRLFMGGLLMQESESLPSDEYELNYLFRDFKALIGDQTCILAGRGLDSGGTPTLKAACGQWSSADFAAAIAIGSVKLV